MSPQATGAEELAGVGGAGCGVEICAGPGVGVDGTVVVVGESGGLVGVVTEAVVSIVVPGPVGVAAAGPPPQAANKRMTESRSSGWSARTGMASPDDNGVQQEYRVSGQGRCVLP